MKISKKVLKIISDSPSIQGKIAEATKMSWRTIERWLDDNSEDGGLTTASSMKVIREETGLTDDEILTESAPVHK